MIVQFFLEVNTVVLLLNTNLRQMILNFLTLRFQPWRQYQFLTKFIRCLIDRIARSIRCDFKKDAPRRSEIDRMKPETIDIFTWIHSQDRKSTRLNSSHVAIS